MTGKINIVFGFLYLALTAVLGPAHLVPQLYEGRGVMQETAAAVEEVKKATAEDGDPAVLAGKNSAAITGLFDAMRAEHLSGKGAHSHGNLEALLNIVAGLVLLTLAVPCSFKALLTILFLAGAVFHSGMLYLGSVLGASWAYKLLIIGEVSLIAGLVLMGVAAVIGIGKRKEGRAC